MGNMCVPEPRLDLITSRLRVERYATSDNDVKVQLLLKLQLHRISLHCVLKNVDERAETSCERS